MCWAEESQAGSTVVEKQCRVRGSVTTLNWGCSTDCLGLILPRIYNPKALGAKIMNINGMFINAEKNGTKSCQNRCPQHSAGARKSPQRAFPRWTNCTGFLFSLLAPFSLPPPDTELQLWNRL